MADRPAAPTQRRPLRADAARNVRALTEAAKELFDEQGLDVPVDDVARRAGVGNATLYRYFPTRADLIVAVYADEVADLCTDGALLLAAEAPEKALLIWLDRFVVHVATKRALALAGTENNGEQRTELFDTWHKAMRTVATDLYDQACLAGTVSPQVSVEELLALASAAALAGNGPEQARRLMTMIWYGVAGDAAT